MTPNQQPVAPSLKQRFADWIDARTAQGIETYGGPLTTDNGTRRRTGYAGRTAGFLPVPGTRPHGTDSGKRPAAATYRRGAGTVGVAGIGELQMTPYYDRDGITIYHGDVFGRDRRSRIV